MAVSEVVGVPTYKVLEWGWKSRCAMCGARMAGGWATPKRGRTADFYHDS